MGITYQSDSGHHMGTKTKTAHTQHGQLSPSPAQLLWGLGRTTGSAPMKYVYPMSGKNCEKGGPWVSAKGSRLTCW